MTELDLRAISARNRRRKQAQRLRQPFDEERALGYLDAIHELRSLVARGMNTEQTLQVMRTRADEMLGVVLRR